MDRPGLIFPPRCGPWVYPNSVLGWGGNIEIVNDGCIVKISVLTMNIVYNVPYTVIILLFDYLNTHRGSIVDIDTYKKLKYSKPKFVLVF